MKALPLLAFGLLTVMVSAMDKEEAKEMFINMSQDCKEKVGAKDDDVNMMVNEQYPDSKEGKCMMACMQEQFGLVKEDKFSEPGFMSLAAMAAGDDKEKLEKAANIAKACKDVTDSDKCEQAVKLGKCMEEHAKKEGFKMEQK